ncbi:uncharacterized protein LOC117341849 [Pecten maximus]|uniref:uncharacterized protein LOC117341849 n=1 Tax=Pecten maximus TaxID=6579 RepID=UPI00145828F0|nr:uncharacterized protein LOC117341849 [Pecten maximus]
MDSNMENTWPVLNLKILCFGREILARTFLHGVIHTSKKSQKTRGMSSFYLFLHLCLILSNDVELNPGPIHQGSNPLPGSTSVTPGTYLPVGTGMNCVQCTLPVYQLDSVTCVSCPALFHSACVTTNQPQVNLEWICDGCVDHFSTFYDFYQASDTFIQDLPKGLTFGHLNVRGLLNKVDHLRILLRNHTFDIFTVSESHLDNTIDDSDILIKGYNLFRKDRNRHGGGVATYIRDNISASEDSVDLTGTLELLSIKIQQKNSSPIICVNVYRPPNERVDWFDHFDSVIDRLSTENKNIIVLGDFNIDQQKSPRLKDLMLLYNLNQQITVPTRECKDSKTLIDHIYTADSFGCVESGVIPLGISDHHLVYTIRKTRGFAPKAHTTIKYRKFKDVNLENLAADMQQVPWSSIEVFDDVDDVWASFKDLFMSVIDKHAPFHEKRVKAHSEKWINDDIINEMHNRDYLHDKARKTKSDSDWALFRAGRTEYF